MDDISKSNLIFGVIIAALAMGLIGTIFHYQGALKAERKAFRENYRVLDIKYASAKRELREIRKKYKNLKSDYQSLLENYRKLKENCVKYSENHENN